MRCKLLFLYLLFIVCVTPLISINNITRDPNRAFEITESNPTGIIVKFTLPEFQVEGSIVDGNEKVRILSESDNRVSLASGIDVPYYSTTLAIPNTGKVSLEVLEERTETIKLTSFGSKHLDRNSEELPVITEELETVNLSTPAIMRDLRVVTLSVSPFNYDKQTKNLSTVNEVTYKISILPERGENELELGNKKLSASFLPLYQNVVDNFNEVVGRHEIDYEKRLLILYADSDNQQYLDKLDELIQWKRQKGFIVSGIEVAGLGLSEIKTIIQNHYNNENTRPDYVMLIGNPMGAYDITCYNYNSGASDYEYSCLDGNDSLGDVIIGRVPMDSVVGFLTMTEKIFAVERNLDRSNAVWLNHIILDALTQYCGKSVLYVNYYVKLIAGLANNEYSFSEIYDNQLPPEEIFNQGSMLYHFRGGNYNWIENATFSNANKLPHCIMISSNSGNFNTMCPTKTVVNYGTPDSLGGALTAIGLSSSPSHTIYRNIYSANVAEGVFVNGLRDMGSALLYSKWQSTQLLPTYTPDYISLNHQCNLLGDPTAEVFIGIPSELQLSCRESITINENQYAVLVTDANGVGVEDVCVTLVNDSLQEIAFTDITGRAMVDVPVGSAIADSLIVTASKQDFVPTVQYLQIQAEGQVSITQAIFFDDSGNNDNVPDAGEVLELSVELQNNTDIMLNQLNLSLTTQDPYITIINNQATIPCIPESGTASINTPFTLSTDPNTPDGHTAELLVHCNDSVYPVILTVHNAMVCVSECILINSDQYLSPEQEVSLSLTILNSGSSRAEDIYVCLSSESNLVSFSDSEAFIGDILPQQAVTNLTDTLMIVTSENYLTESARTIYATFSNNSGFLQTCHFTLEGEPENANTPTGPDAFGHYIYHNNDSEHFDTPIYEWIEIAVPEGGNGSQFYFADHTHDADNTDQLYSITIDEVDLPFNFTFYGQIYDKAYVCSNGFITFNETQFGASRNYEIPGAMSPNPVIAAFWDNLEIHTDGGVYYYYDSTNNYFVIEWYNVCNSADPQARETFEIILYDPEYYPTSTGDGLVKIQYQEFNDIDSGSNSELVHGHYSTVGIGDHTGLDGMTYLFDNNYQTTANPITDGTALLITSEPFYEPFIRFEEHQIIESNSNGFLEPDETIYMSLTMSNVGTRSGENIQVTINANSPYLNFINNTIDGISIDPNDTFTTQEYFLLQIEPSIPGSMWIPIYILMTDGTHEWYGETQIFASSAGLNHFAYRICDFQSGNGNGLPDAGETLYLIHELHSYGLTDIEGISVGITSDNNSVMFGETVNNIAKFPAQSSMQTWYEVTLPSNLNIGDEVQIMTNYSKEGWFDETFNATLEIGIHSYQNFGLIEGIVTASHPYTEPEMGLVNIDTRYCSVDESSTFKAFAGIGNHALDLALPHYQPTVIEGLELSNPDNMVLSDIEFTPEILPVATEVTGIYEYPYLSINWQAPITTVYNVVGYNVYKAIGQDDFTLVGFSEYNQYIDGIGNTGTYNYQIEVVYEDDTSFHSETLMMDITGAEDNSNALRTELLGNYPNPFNPTTTIAYSIAKQMHVAIDIYNIKGQLVKSLVNQIVQPGNHTIEWDGFNSKGKECASGLYFYKLKADSKTTIKKALLIK